MSISTSRSIAFRVLGTTAILAVALLGCTDNGSPSTADGGNNNADGGNNNHQTDERPGLVPAGSFWMGCAPADTQCDLDESPYHEVNLDGFFMDLHEATVADYGACVDAGVCTEPGTGNYANWGVVGREDHPVNYVDWGQASAYCTWVGGRLPTEAEWEKAARGTDGRIYPWGDATATCDYAVIDYGGAACGLTRTWSVCSKSPAGDSPYGLCDMAGNVREWVSDWYDIGYYSSSPTDNPQGPAVGSWRVGRGGSWDVLAPDVRASTRNGYTPTGRGAGFGFRCAREEA